MASRGVYNIIPNCTMCVCRSGNFLKYEFTTLASSGVTSLVMAVESYHFPSATAAAATSPRVKSTDSFL